MYKQPINYRFAEIVAKPWNLKQQTLEQINSKIPLQKLCTITNFIFLCQQYNRVVLSVTVGGFKQKREAQSGDEVRTRAGVSRGCRIINF